MNETLTQGTGLARRAEGGVTRWSPWNELNEVRRQMDDLFSRAFGYTPLSHLIPGDSQGLEPDVDIFETEDKVVVYCALAGYTPNDINVEATNGTITIRGERRPFVEHEKARHFRRGWVSGFNQFNATYTLPTEIDPKQVRAVFPDGILQLELPKTAQARTKAIKVNVQKGS